MAGPIRFCVVCGDRIAGQGKLYCSHACHSETRRLRTERTCERPGCDRTFTPSASLVRRGYGRFCSRSCAKQGPERALVCAQCGETRVLRPGDQARQFCSNRCSGLAKRTRVTVACERCGGSFAAIPSVRALGFARFCSRECARPSATARLCARAGCGATVTATARLRAKGRGKYCSRRCYELAKRKPRHRIECARPGCRKHLEVLASESARRYCSRRCWTLASAPREFRCQVCHRQRSAPAWRNAQFCSRACYYAARRGQKLPRDPELSERDQRILALHTEGLKAPVILARLASERDEWGYYSPAMVRQVISRARKGAHECSVTLLGQGRPVARSAART
jgi:endogenous inhibitor of DNA gyrase (YacG/DUF329 family)